MSDTDRIEKKIVLRASRTRVWRALSDSGEFGAWFGVKFEGPFRVGEPAHGVLGPVAGESKTGDARKPYEGLPFTFEVEKMEPERFFSFRWHPYAIERNRDYSSEPMTLVEFMLEEVEDGVALTVIETGFDNIPLERRAKAFTENQKGWGMVTKMLEEYLVNTP
jgi:uncharacterized protein YndB with AHSA1/START domain